MLAVVIAVSALVLFVLGYYIYGSFLAEKVFRLRDEEVAPSVELRDNKDYIPTDKKILFGHHFASIAGLGPILGPAVAVIWGWLPGLIWIVAGSILMGAVHDFGALVVSVRHDGRSIGEVLGRVMNPRARLLFMALSAFLISLAMGVFAYVVGALLAALYPEAVIPVFGLMVVAVILGLLIYKRGWGLLPVTVLGIVLMTSLLWGGVEKPVNIYKGFIDRGTKAAVAKIEKQAGKELSGVAVKKQLAASVAAADKDAAKAVGKATSKAQNTLIWILLLYAGIASVVPVWLLLQPRDYINSYLLYVGMILLYGGLFIARPDMVAPMYRPFSEVGQMLFPMLFVTIACGAISGFHNLVASGTTAKQLGRVTEAKIIGYGAMLAEAALAVAVMLACSAGIEPGSYAGYYGTWGHLTHNLPSKAAAFVDGSANIFSHLGIPVDWGKALIALVMVGFAMTTLDSGTRLLRYNLEELGRSIHFPLMGNRFVATAIGIAMLAFFAFVKVNTPKGAEPAGLAVWALFGTANQMLAALGLLAVAAYLRLKGRSSYMYLLPFAFLLIVTSAALYLRFKVDIGKGNWSLVATETVTAILTIWLIVEGAFFFLKTPKANGEAEA